jgi:hypothetical protein
VFNQETNARTNASFTFSEKGLSFKPIVAGKTNTIVVKLPIANNAVRVTIWDLASKAILRTETVAVTETNVNTQKSITPLSLEKNKEYVISMNIDNCFVHYRTNMSNTTYRITSDNIIITTYCENPGDLQKFPYPADVNDGYLGDCSFKFQQTE